MLTVWGRRNSANVQKVLWFVAELSLEHRQIDAGGAFGRTGEPAFRALNPHGLVPVIEDDGVAIWESHAILRYLAAKYGAPGFWDDDPAVRSRPDRWMDWSQTTLQPEFLGGVFGGYYRTQEARRDWPAINRAVSRCAAHVRLLDSILDGRAFIVGDSLSLADIAIGALLYRYFELEIERPSAPNVEAWYRRLQERPAYREHVMVDFSALRAAP